MENITLGTGGAASRPPGFIALLPSHRWRSRRNVYPSLRLMVWPRRRRSGSIPGEPCPPLRPDSGYDTLQPDRSRANKTGQIDVLPQGGLFTPPHPDAAQMAGG